MVTSWIPLITVHKLEWWNSAYSVSGKQWLLSSCCFSKVSPKHNAVREQPWLGVSRFTQQALTLKHKVNFWLLVWFQEFLANYFNWFPTWRACLSSYMAQHIQPHQRWVSQPPFCGFTTKNIKMTKFNLAVCHQSHLLNKLNLFCEVWFRCISFGNNPRM